MHIQLALITDACDLAPRVLLCLEAGARNMQPYCRACSALVLRHWTVREPECMTFFCVAGDILQRPLTKAKSSRDTSCLAWLAATCQDAEACSLGGYQEGPLGVKEPLKVMRTSRNRRVQQPILAGGLSNPCCVQGISPCWISRVRQAAVRFGVLRLKHPSFLPHTGSNVHKHG